MTCANLWADAGDRVTVTGSLQLHQLFCLSFLARAVRAPPTSLHQHHFRVCSNDFQPPAPVICGLKNFVWLPKPRDRCPGAETRGSDSWHSQRPLRTGPVGFGIWLTPPFRALQDSGVAPVQQNHQMSLGPMCVLKRPAQRLRPSINPGCSEPTGWPESEVRDSASVQDAPKSAAVPAPKDGGTEAGVPGPPESLLHSS